MKKIFVFLGCKNNESVEAFRARYLNSHKDKIIAFGVERYLANTCEIPSQELLDAGWGIFNTDDIAVVAMDEIWTTDVNNLMKQYKEENVLYAYLADEHIVRSCVVDTPEGESSFWLKRVTLIRRKPDMQREAFFHYWQEVHGPMAADHIIGAGIYIQNNVIKELVCCNEEWNGVTELQYWNLKAFQYGHFSQENSRTILRADCDEFIGPGLTFLFKEYVQKK